MPNTARKPRAASMARLAPRVTVTSLPSLDPVNADVLAPFWDAFFAVAQRVALTQRTTSTHAAA